jgi:uncharacterized membrane protein YdjX (TVP38/TMEM64 family)
LNPSSSKPSTRFSPYLKWGVLLLLVSVLIYVFESSYFFRIISVENIVAYVEKAQLNPWMEVVFYLAFIIGVMFLPITVFLIIGGVLLDFRWALPFNLLAATTGAWLSFLLARWLGKDVVHRILRGKMKYIDQLAQKSGLKSILILRLLGIPPFIVTNYALGLSSMNSKDFVLGTFFGIAPWMCLVTYAAHSLWNALIVGGFKGFRVALLELVGPLILLSGIIILSTFVASYLKRTEKKKSEPKSHSNL